ncbi:AAA family ATPase [Endozoicomonas euniceicola]|uniref:Rad50/SbcC-type AAA domain-containing protein n=1 Tax=Endozoicomonas euniceicola TaxID=1234143 RepID=A0ABY6GN16_9GAMM|nr:hypothetical protein [Endozoicomonas euniceicola]UYM14118.1 hypothetical protein NX720_14505 [Endozoicomonas euniceicola]
MSGFATCPACACLWANGSGKSTLFDVFGFLKDALAGNVRTALQKRGGFKEVVTRGCIDQPIVFTLQFRLAIGGVERLVTYVLEIKLVKGYQKVAGVRKISPHLSLNTNKSVSFQHLLSGLQAYLERIEVA